MRMRYFVQNLSKACMHVTWWNVLIYPCMYSFLPSSYLHTVTKILITWWISIMNSWSLIRVHIPNHKLISVDTASWCEYCPIYLYKGTHAHIKLYHRTAWSLAPPAFNVRSRSQFYLAAYRANYLPTRFFTLKPVPVQVPILLLP